MTLCPIKLWDAALTLENDGEFYKAYVTQRPAEYSKDRRNRINSALGRLKIYGSDVKDREALRRYLDEAWNLPPARHATDSETNTGPVVEFWKEEVRYPPMQQILSINHNTVPAEQIPTPLDQPQPETTKETIMTTTTNAIEITTKTLINGQDIKGLTDSQIYSLIADQEAEIKKLEAIENKPKRLVNEIEKRKAGIKALVDYLDSKEAK